MSFPTGVLSHQTGLSLTATEAKEDKNNALLKQKRLLKKSYSIQDKIGYNVAPKQPITTEMLFFGVKLFNKMENKCRPKSTATQSKLPYSQIQLLPEPYAPPRPKPNSSKLVKRTKKHEFR